jgi:glyoxylase I family protein
MPDDVKMLSQIADMPVTVTGLDHVVLRVTDMNRSIAFYGDVLGCPIERRLESIGLVQLRAGTSMIDLVPCGPGETPGMSRDGRNMDHYAVRVAKMDPASIAAHLEAHGVAVGPVQRRYGAEGYGSSIYITDPDGNTVELKGPPEA